MPNTSATGGYLLPETGTPPVDDVNLDLLFQDAVSKITGLPGNLVRPRWQPRPPTDPASHITWCAIGVTGYEGAFDGYHQHRTEDDGSTEANRWEMVTILATFYGPKAAGYAHVFRDGLTIRQNTEALRASGFGAADFGNYLVTGELINNQWVRRVDLTFKMSRIIPRVYAIKTLAEPVIIIQNETE